MPLVVVGSQFIDDPEADLFARKDTLILQSINVRVVVLL